MNQSPNSCTSSEGDLGNPSTSAVCIICSLQVLGNVRHFSTLLFTGSKKRDLFLTQYHQAWFIKLSIPFNMMAQQASDDKPCWVMETLVTGWKERINYQSYDRSQIFKSLMLFWDYIFETVLWINKNLPDPPFSAHQLHVSAWFGGWYITTNMVHVRMSWWSWCQWP